MAITDPNYTILIRHVTAVWNALRGFPFDFGPFPALAVLHLNRGTPISLDFGDGASVAAWSLLAQIMLPDMNLAEFTCKSPGTFRTGTDSPVSSDSSTDRLRAESTALAGTKKGLRSTRGAV